MSKFKTVEAKTLIRSDDEFIHLTPWLELATSSSPMILADTATLETTIEFYDKLIIEEYGEKQQEHKIDWTGITLIPIIISMKE